MAEISNKVLEGIFAIKKPPSLSSAQVLRDLQQQFAESKTFAPLRRQTEQQHDSSGSSRRKRRKVSLDNVFKMGHGGTLDPLATGVLIVGIGRGTKQLNTFLECTKTYETVVLFGKDTDTYDVAGKIVAEASTKGITKALVEEKLANYRGNIKQIPPLYSALKIQGMKAYEYARTGQKLPRELESRDMKVDECVMLDWYEAGEHDYRWPAAHASGEDQAAAKRLVNLQKNTRNGAPPEDPVADHTKTAHETIPPETGSRQADGTISPSPHSKDQLNALSPNIKRTMHTHDLPVLMDIPADAPAVRVRLTVSSGFYVRSFAHDLGLACDSFGSLAELVRTRQAEYTTLPTSSAGLTECLTYDDLDQGEAIWGPKMSQVLDNWMKENPSVSSESRRDDRDDPRHGRYHQSSRNSTQQTSYKRRRNSSSAEE